MGRTSDKRGEAAARIALPADCRMACVPALRTTLTAALARPASELDGAAVARVDTAALQLLAAFVRAAAERRHPVRWLGASAVLGESAGLLGLAQVLDLPASSPA